MKKIIYRLAISYLGFWAKYKIKLTSPVIVGVTGSVGKSSFIYLLDSILAPRFKVKTTFHGNSEIGLPLEILNLRDKTGALLSWLEIFLLAPFKGFQKANYEYLIAEMGVDEPDEPKNMSYLLKTIQPDIGVFLTVSPAHTQQFMKVVDVRKGDAKEQLLRAIAKEKGLIVTTLNPNKVAIINSDSKYIKELIPQIKARLIRVGREKESDFQLTGYEVDLEGTKFEFQNQNKKYQITFDHQLLPKDFTYAILSAIATAQSLGVNIEDSINDLQNSYKSPPGRQSMLTGKKNSVLLDSSYNSSPDALQAFLEITKDIKVKGSKVGILGDMRELGEISSDEHKDAAKLASTTLDYIVTVGPLMKDYFVPELKKMGFPSKNIFSFNTSLGVGEFVAEKLLKRDDLVLIKGSQNTVFLEQAVKELMDNPEQANKLLCRQTKEWDDIRSKFFKQNTNS